LPIFHICTGPIAHCSNFWMSLLLRKHIGYGSKDSQVSSSRYSLNTTTAYMCSTRFRKKLNGHRRLGVTFVIRSNNLQKGKQQNGCTRWRKQPQEYAAVKKRCQPEHEAKRFFFRLVAKCLLSNECARPPASQRQEMKCAFRCTPGSFLGCQLVGGVDDEGEQARNQIKGQDQWRDAGHKNRKSDNNKK